MSYDVINAEYTGGYKIKIAFENGKVGIADFSAIIDKGGVFNKLKDIDFFKSFLINEDLGVITWGDEIDVAPETLYSLAIGDPLPEWMTPEESYRKDRKEEQMRISIFNI